MWAAGTRVAAELLKLGVLRAWCCAMMLLHASPSKPFKPLFMEGAGEAAATERAGEGAGEDAGDATCT